MILKRTESCEQSERRFQAALHVALSLLGWVLPDTGGVVEATDSDDKHNHEQLPDELRDPLAILDRDELNAAPEQETRCNPSEVFAEQSALDVSVERIANTK